MILFFNLNIFRSVSTLGGGVAHGVELNITEEKTDSCSLRRDKGPGGNLWSRTGSWSLPPFQHLLSTQSLPQGFPLDQGSESRCSCSCWGCPPHTVSWEDVQELLPLERIALFVCLGGVLEGFSPISFFALYPE